jgi:hypothetical protein
MRSLYSLADSFLKKRVTSLKKEATLLSDMAVRMLVSSMDDQSFTLPVGRKAASGVINILNYGVRAIKSELKYYAGIIDFELAKPTAILKSKIEKFDEINATNIDQIIDLCSQSMELFLDEESWDDLYGGTKWADIAKALRDVAIKYKEYLLVEKDTEEEVKAIKNLLIYMNIFDGVAHNSGSIYSKLVDTEHSRSGRPFSESESEETLNKIMRLRNLSESEHTQDVMKEIIPNLDIQLPYKDYIRKIKMNPEFYEDTRDRAEESILRVDRLKQIKGYVDRLAKENNKLIMRVKEEFFNLQDIYNEFNEINQNIPQQYIVEIMQLIKNYENYLGTMFITLLIELESEENNQATIRDQLMPIKSQQKTAKDLINQLDIICVTGQISLFEFNKLLNELKNIILSSEKMTTYLENLKNSI